VTPLRLLAALVLIVALALPATALAGGSAGDQQYQDPLGNSTPSKPKKHSSPTTTTTPQTQVTPSNGSSSSTSTQTSSTTTTTSSGSGSNSNSGQLPRTGVDIRLMGGIGGLLVAGGLLLRRRFS
jgi:LPXTG-motif cell wall-anchored protein